MDHSEWRDAFFILAFLPCRTVRDVSRKHAWRWSCRAAFPRRKTTSIAATSSCDTRRPFSIGPRRMRYNWRTAHQFTRMIVPKSPLGKLNLYAAKVTGQNKIIEPGRLRPFLVDSHPLLVRSVLIRLSTIPASELQMLLKKAPKWSDWFPRISAHPTQIRKDVEKRIKDGVDPSVSIQKICFNIFACCRYGRNSNSSVPSRNRKIKIRLSTKMNRYAKCVLVVSASWTTSQFQSIGPISLCRMSLDLLDSCANDPLWPEQMVLTLIYNLHITKVMKKV